MKSADSMSASLPAGAQCESLIPISWPWNTGRPWWPLWVMRAMALPGRSSRKTSNALRLVLGPRTWSSPLAMICSISSWRRRTLRPNLGKAGREHHREFGSGGDRVPQDGQRLADEDGHQVQRLLDVGQCLGAGPARHHGPVGVDEVHRGTAFLGPHGDLLGQRSVGSCIGVGRAHDGHSLGAEEGVEIDGAEGGRAAGDIQLASVVRGPRCHVPPSCRAGTPVQFHICRRGHPDRARRSPAPPGEGPRGPSPYMTPVSVSIRLDARSSPVKAEFGRIVGPPSPPLR